MSINVTVTGNPISIKRGRMVTADPIASKQEFERRRKIRLEQVRQQSKQIAEEVRNRVRKEKSRQQSDLEKQGAEKLKELQARKLLDLQNQYEESLNDFGQAEREAEQVRQQEKEEMESRKREDEAKAKTRGELAAQKLQAEKNEQSLKKAVPVQQKKFAREVENLRSTFVSSLRSKKTPFKKKRSKKKVVTDINISSVIQESSSGTSVESDKKIQENAGGLDSRSCSIVDGSEPNSPVNMNEMPESVLKEKSCASLKQNIGKISNPSVCLESIRTSSSDQFYPLETRISDRIKNRKIPELHMEKPDPVLDELCALSQMCPKSGTSKRATKTHIKKSAPSKITYSSKPSVIQEIPSKPTVSIRDSSKSVVQPSVSIPSKKQASKKVVKSYDHEVHYTKKIVPENISVERIPEKSIEILPPNPNSDTENQTTMKQQDKAAIIRGRKALEKERITREYKELLKQLPILQRQEFVCGKTRDKPEYHMTEERLGQLEERRQIRMENAYKDAMRNFDVETKIPAKRGPNRRPPFKVVDLMDNKTAGSYTLNVGTWGLEDDEEYESKNKTEDLKDLLDKLKEQHKLLKENEELPENSNLDSILNDLSTAQTLEMLKKAKKKTDKKKTKTPPNTDVSSSSSLSSRRTDEIRRQKVKQQHKRTSETSLNPSPSKKARTRVIVLQNTSTQTTPKPTDSKQTATEEAELSFVKSQEEVKSTCEKGTSPLCVCKKLPEINHTCKKEKVVKSESKLCEIVIKIHDDQSNPEIKISPRKLVPVEEMKESETPKWSNKQQVKVKETKRVVFPEKKSTWREQLSQTSEKNTSTSTSYYSPPEVPKARRMQESARKTANEVLRNKPQQRNVTDSSDSSTADLSRTVLQKYVKKLLAMSRTSIENLQVSTVSEVSTPSGSVIEVASNKPDKFLLKHILNTLNMSKREAEQHFQEVPPNSLDSINYYTDTESTTLTSSVSSVGKVVKTKNVADTKEIPGETNSQTTMMAKYEEIAETCSRRISNLTAMIEQVRLEKERILHSPNSTSEKEQSTSYLDIPQKKPEETEESLNDLSEKIIEIDENLVKTLKTMSESHIKEAFTVQCETQTPREEEEDIIVTRFKKLLSSSDEKSNSPSKDDRQLDFVPLLFDIPKLPKLETSSEPETPTSRIRRPPPAKGLLVAKKFNGDITAVPHELSTIVEAESQVSTRVQQSDGSDPKLSSPASQKQKSTSREEDVQNDSPESKRSSETSLPDLLTESMRTIDEPQHQQQAPSEVTKGTPQKAKKLSKMSSSDSSSELEGMESLLREMGMGWAIATLRKTQEALAMSSSSSSMDLSVKQKEALAEVSVGDMSLKELIAKLKASTSTNESSLSSFMRDIQDVSSILGSSGKRKEEKTQRTSTPVLRDKESNRTEPNRSSVRNTDSEDKSKRDDKDIKFYSMNSSNSS